MKSNVGGENERQCSDLAGAKCWEFGEDWPRINAPSTSGTTKRQFPASAGSGAPAGSELQLLPDFGAPVITEASVQTGAPIPTGALAELSL